MGGFRKDVAEQALGGREGLSQGSELVVEDKVLNLNYIDSPSWHVGPL